MSGNPSNVIVSEALLRFREEERRQAAYDAEIAAAEELERQLEAEQASFPPLILAQYYKYKPLEDAYTNLRILAVAPGNADDALQGSLQEQRLRTGQIYKALSYVWGPPKFTESIYVDGRKLKITPNLASALRYFRSPSKWLWIWVDQVCINQTDPAERSKQVRTMHNIYKNAEEVLAWLGPDVDKHAAKAFSLIQALRAILGDHLLSSLCKKAGADFDWIPKSHWKSLKQLCEVGWFSRVWIPQEIGTDSRASIHWGKRHIDWEELSDGIRKLDTCQELKRRHNIDSSTMVSLHRRFVRQNDSDEEQAEANFVYQLCLSAKSSATDPRDYVFSLLGHFSALLPNGTPIIQPDYQNSVTDIYHETAIRILRSDSTLTLLNAVRDTGSSDSRSPETARLPSWVPRWDLRTSQSLIGYPGRFNASGETSYNVSFDRHFRTLTVFGLSVDSIKRVLNRPFPYSSDSPSFKSQIQLAWNLCMGTKEVPPGMPRRNFKFTEVQGYNHIKGYENPLKAFISTLAPESTIEGLSCNVSAYKSGIATLGKLFPSRKQEIRSLATFEDELETDFTVWMQAAEQNAGGRKFAITSLGHFAMVPSMAVKGDLLCILFGGETPYVLRKSSDPARHQLVGETYTYGLMHGQAISVADAGKLDVETFEIC
ncbi:hypothetical protein N0V82_007070 [Gnomoniopsis sp. IMI 355080]|nr:hypothetical protein N0V82_007070 [Gnomoniopsis sp. IMI 355080]